LSLRWAGAADRSNPLRKSTQGISALGRWLRSFLQLEVEPAGFVFPGDDFKARGLGQFEEMVSSLPFDNLHAVAGVDLLPWQSDVERVEDIKLTRVSLPGGEHGVPDEEPAAWLENAMDLLKDLGMVGRRDVHECEENGGRSEDAVQELEVSGVHDDLEQGFTRGLFELPLAEIDGDDLGALELADDALTSAPDIEDKALARKVRQDDFELVVLEDLFRFGPLLGGQAEHGGEKDCGKHRRGHMPIPFYEHASLLKQLEWRVGARPL